MERKMAADVALVMAPVVSETEGDGRLVEEPARAADYRARRSVLTEHSEYTRI